MLINILHSNSVKLLTRIVPGNLVRGLQQGFVDLLQRLLDQSDLEMQHGLLHVVVPERGQFQAVDELT